MHSKPVFVGLAVGFLLTACGSNKTENMPATDSAVTNVGTDSTGSATVISSVVPGPDTSVKITVEYAKMVAMDAYFWAWPMVNIYNRRLAFSRAPTPGLIGGILPFAPLNRLSMLHSYVEPAERQGACPNQDVVYGAAVVALDLSPAVIQVPDFGKRFWVVQVVDIRTDAFAALGAMYHTQPGFYLLVGPNWKGEIPTGITKVFRATTNTGFVIPRIFLNDDPEDLPKVLQVIKGINLYPLADFDGKMKQVEWTKLPAFPSTGGGNEETRWVFPDKFIDQLPAVLADAAPLPGEEARYAQVLAVIAAARNDSALRAAMVQGATEAEQQLIKPVFQFRNFGIQLPYHWSTINNGAAFGTDYFTRTATSKSNILVNVQRETKYFYQDLDENGVRLNSANNYAVTFPKGQTPPVNGFWSLTLYNKYHFFEPNEIHRFSLGTKNKNLKYNADGSLTIYIQHTRPAPNQVDNWLPSPKTDDFTLYMRAYWPDDRVLSGSWTPPPVKRSKL
jgi:hypothetical protein